MDDFFIVHPSKRYLKELIPWIREFLKEELELELHPDKIELQHYSRGVAFLGAYVRPYRKYPSKRTAGFFSGSGTQAGKREFQRKTRSGKKKKKRLRKMLAVLNSYQGAFEAFQIIRSAG
ncbi:hypothetical protein NXW78_22955 [Bacteroides ovatus]|nr:hypothetical protein [Bacteroides ovatus]